MEILNLSKQLPIEVIDQNQQNIFYIPEGQVLENIPVIWTMLENVASDWKSISRAYPAIFTGDTEKGKRADIEFMAFRQLKPRLFQCLFSYIVFFFMLENGYHFIYSELNRLNRELDLRINHDKPPKRSEFVSALWKLRNVTIAHWAGTEKNQNPDSIAGRQWGYAFGHKKRHEEWVENIEHIIPGFPGVVIASIPETHIRCSRYLGQFDQVCADYLKEIVAQMPKTHEGIEYHGWKWTESGLVSTRSHSRD